jgi:type IV secretion system protein VirD4
MGMGRAAVALIGPTRSGKTTAAIGSILDWNGPAVLCSVKADLLAVTEARRAGCGPIHVFDPAGSTGHPTAAWSPLRSAGSVKGAIKAARALVEAAPRTTNSNGEQGDFWLQMAEGLVAALLALAANAQGRTFADVTRWVLATDMPAGDFVGEVAPLLRALKADADRERKAVGEFAATVLEGLWRNDHRTVSSVYATARTLVWPWVDPVVAAATGGCSIEPAELLDNNGSLYVCIPLADQNRLRPVLGGLLNDVIGVAYERYVATGKPLDPPLLVVIDEAATLRPDQLPSWAATLAGIGVQLVTAWQSVSQIDAAYVRQTQAILTNHITKLFYAGMSDPVGLDYVSRLVGDEHLRARLSDQRGEVSNGEPVATVPVAPPAVLRQIRRGDALLIHATLPPAHIRLRPWYRDRRSRRDPQHETPDSIILRVLAGGGASRVAASLHFGSRLRSGSRSAYPPAP